MKMKIFLSVIIVIFALFVLDCFVKVDGHHHHHHNHHRKEKNEFERVNLVSDIAGVARYVDRNLVNPWGIARSDTGPWWVSDNGAGLSTVYDGEGISLPPFSIIIPPAFGSQDAGVPTGVVFNERAKSHPEEFIIKRGLKSGPAIYIFATEDGTIAGWNPLVDPLKAITVSDRFVFGAVYKGAAIALRKGLEPHSHPLLYVTNFFSGFIEVFDSKFNLVDTFTDHKISKCNATNVCFAPFGIRNINDDLYVTFALQKPGKHDDQAGPGNGFVVVFDRRGSRELISHGKLDSPWGLVLSPKHFGPFSKLLLVANFGDGLIHAYDIKDGDYKGELKDEFGNPLRIDGLWAIDYGNGKTAGSKERLYFSAGIAEEQHGLFGYIQHRSCGKGEEDKNDEEAV